nr:[Fe-Fe] hydrogenase large subunit C-terminal domain-containing protein [Thermosipho sp. 1244]
MTCIRTCKVNANIVENNAVNVVSELCLSCGDCVETCPENARIFLDETDVLEKWIKDNEYLIAIIAPAYVAHFIDIDPLQIVSALKKIGFKEVHEVAMGAELTTLAVIDELKNKEHIITSPCPSIVNFIKKWEPSLSNNLSRAVSPMIALGKYLKNSNPKSKVVFIGPCIAKKTEIEDKNIKGIVDLVLTFEELEKIFKEKNININSQDKELFDGMQPLVGTSYPISGGLARTASYYLRKKLDTILDNDILIIEGKDRVIDYLKYYKEKLEKGKKDSLPKIVDILYCEGCIDGPTMRKDISIPEKKKIVANYTKSRIVTKKLFKIKGKQIAKNLVSEKQLKKIYSKGDYFRNFEITPITYKIPSDNEINKILDKIGMLEHPLNCGACGYDTCKDRAIAVYNNLLSWDDCVQYKIRQQEKLINEVNEKNNRISEMILNFKTTLENIKLTTTEMVHAVDALGNDSKNVLEASERGIAVVEKLKDVQTNVESTSEIVLTSIKNVSENIKNLKEITQTISAIANQTNLLALNAAIESARMGSAGKAFSVLADEIRKLSNQSHESSEDIEESIDKILSLFNELEEKAKGIELIKDVTQNVSNKIITEFDNIKTLLNTVSASIEEVSAAIEEVKASVDEITNEAENNLINE